MATNQDDFSGLYMPGDPIKTEDDFSGLYMPGDNVETETEIKTETQPPVVKDSDIEITMDDLDKRKDWLKQARTIYNFENPDKSFKGTDKKLSDWFKNRHSSLNHNLTDLISTGFDTSEMNDEVKQAWSQSMDTYEKTDSDFATFFRAVQNTFEDPLTYAGLFGTGGLGLIAKIAGKKGAKSALKNLLGRFQFKEQLNKQIETEVSKKAAKEFAETGVSKEVTKEVLKKARIDAAKKVSNAQTLSGAASGAGWGLGFGVAQEDFEIGIEKKDSADLLAIAVETLGGVALGTGLGRYVPRLSEKVMRNRALQKIADTPTPTKKKQKIIEKEIFKNSDDNQFNNNILSRSIVNSDELEVGGTVEIITDKALTVSQAKRLKETYALHNIDIVPVLGSRKKFKGTKIQESEEVIASDISPGRSVSNKLIAKFKRNFYDDSGLGDLYKEAQQTLTSASRVTERDIHNNFKKLTNAIKKDYKIKNFKNLPDKDLGELNLILDQILRGDKKAIRSLQRKGYNDTVNQLQLMRNNIKDLQEELLSSGVIDKTSKAGKELAVKIRKSADGSEEFYLTRQYEAFDNPKWKSTLQKRDGGQKILDNALNFIYKNNVRNYRNWANNVRNPELKAKWAKEVAEGRTNPNSNPSQIPLSGSRYNQKLAEIKKESNENLQQLLTKRTADDVLSTLNTSAPSIGKASKIVGRRKDVPDQIRAVLGEYKDPFSNYANTVQNLSRLNSQFAYEKRIAELIDTAQAGGEGIKGAAKFKDADPEMMNPLIGALPDRVGDQSQLRKQTDQILKTGRDQNMSAEEIGARLTEVVELEPGIVKPLRGYTAYDEVAEAIAVGNELKPVSTNAIATYLKWQGYTRAAKTVYSPSAISRNFMGSGMMALGAGYLRPSKVRGMMDVARGLVDDARWNKTNPKVAKEETEKMITKGLHLNFIQSGLDFNAFRGALNDAGKKDFYNFESPIYKGGVEVKKKVKKYNTSAVKFYQAMDDVWKQFSFLNEQDMQRQTLIDLGKNPDAVVRTIKTPAGLDVPITELDIAAAKRVNEHMQNYANVPRIVKGFRRLPIADFLAFKTEVARTSKNIIKNGINDFREGNQLMKKGEQAIDSQGNPTGKLKGQHQRSEGLKRLGSAVAVMSAVPAIGTTSAVMMLGEPDKDEDDKSKLVVEKTGYTRDEGLERILKTDWNPGHHFYYFSTPEKGKGRRLNLSYINPWASGDELITAGVRALKSGNDVNEALKNAAYEGIWNPIKSAFGLSMLFQFGSNLYNNEDEFGNKLFRETDDNLDHARAVGSEAMKAFGPGAYKTIENTYLSLQGEYPKEFAEKEGFIFPEDWDNAPMFSDQYSIKKGKAGTRLYAQDQFTSFLGIKPETYNINTIFPLKLKGLERKRRDTIQDFKKVYQDQGIFTEEELVKAYEKSIAGDYMYSKQIHDLIQQYRAAGATENKDGTLTPASDKKVLDIITKNNLFKERASKRLIREIMKGKFIPSKVNFNDLKKWRAFTKQETGKAPPIRGTWSILQKLNRQYLNEPLGGEVKMKEGGFISDSLANNTEDYIPEVVGDDTEAINDIDNIIFNNFERLNINVDDYDVAKNNLIDFATRTKMAESSGRYDAVNIPEKNKEATTAKGAYQFVKGSVLPALKRLEVRIGKRDWIDKAKEHKDIFKLTPLQQDALFLGDIMEKTIKKTQGLGDKYIKRILKGDVKAMKDLYRIGHHTVGRKGMSPAARKNMNYWFQ